LPGARDVAVQELLLLCVQQQHNAFKGLNFSHAPNGDNKHLRGLGSRFHKKNAWRGPQHGAWHTQSVPFGASLSDSTGHLLG